jgi:hypothetical protein
MGLLDAGQTFGDGLLPSNSLLSSLSGGLLGAPVGVKILLPDAGNKVLLKFDACLSEKHGRESPATTFELEEGSTASDHILMKPITLELTGLITDTPIDVAKGILTTAVSSVVPPLGLVAASAGLALLSAASGASSLSAAAFQQLLDAQAGKKKLSVLTAVKLYTGMYITSLSAPREVSGGRSLTFTLKLTQLTIVGPKSADISGFSNPGLSSSEVHGGKKEAIDPTAAQAKSGFAAGAAFAPVNGGG